MNDWIKQYGSTTGARKFQEGGAMPAPSAQQTAAPEQGAEGGQQLDQMLAQYAQSRDPQLAVAICDALVEMMAQQQQGGAQMAKCGAKMKKGGKGPVFKKLEKEPTTEKDKTKKK